MNYDVIFRRDAKKALVEATWISDATKAAVWSILDNVPIVDAETAFPQLGLVKEAFDMAKADLVPAVRCKDCKHSYKGSPHGLMCECPVGGQNTSLLGDNDFCSCGERRADDATD